MFPAGPSITSRKRISLGSRIRDLFLFTPRLFVKDLSVRHLLFSPGVLSLLSEGKCSEVLENEDTHDASKDQVRTGQATIKKGEPVLRGTERANPVT